MNKENLNEKISAMEKELAAMKLEVNQPEGKDGDAKAWLLSLLPTLTAKWKNGNIKWINGDNEGVFEQDYKSECLRFSYYRVYLILKNKYNLKYNDIQSIITDVVVEALKCKDLTPRYEE